MEYVFRFTRLLAPVTLAGLLALFTAAVVAETDQQKHERELAALRAQIGALEKRLRERTLVKSSAQRALRRVELELAELARRIADLHAELQGNQQQMDRLETRGDELRETLRTHVDRLREQVLAAHRVGQQQFLQMLLNQRDPTLLSRGLTYARYLNNARLDAMHKARDTLSELRELQRDIVLQREKLESSQVALQSERNSLQRSRDERASVLSTIDEEMAAGDSRLTQLRRDSTRLEELLRELRELLSDIPERPDDNRPFGKARGKLPWPARGRIVHRYDAPRAGSHLKWRGILIAAPQGNNVRAVHHGRIVYADWLPGLGLLLILDHEDGYMSLYGYNETLLRETGDWVSPGDVIATVGDSGGQSTSGVYFEIRQAGKPIDPQRWLTRRYSAAG